MRRAVLSTVFALLATSASADFLSPFGKDETRSFQIESALAPLLTRGFSSVEVGAAPGRTTVRLGVSLQAPADFSNTMWSIATQVSRMTNDWVVVTVHRQNMVSLGERYCFLRARQGQIFEGNC